MFIYRRDCREQGMSISRTSTAEDEYKRQVLDNVRYVRNDPNVKLCDDWPSENFGVVTMYGAGRPGFLRNLVQD